MASNFFQNNVVDLNAMWYNSHKKLIKRVLSELDASDRQEELISKFLADPLKIKKQKDPLMPKRPKSSFLYFCDEHRSNVRKSNPKFSMGEVMKALGKKWRECDNKEEYVKMAAEAKVDYTEKLEDYNMNNYYE